MTRGLIAAFSIASSLWLIGAGNASAFVQVERVKTIIVKEVVPDDQQAAPQAVAAPAPPKTPAPPRSRPGPRYRGMTGAIMAPARMGANVADFMARAITNGVTGGLAPAKAEDPA